MVPGRSAGVPEWLDLIKQEFESLSHEAMVAKAQRDECEHKSMFIDYGPSLSSIFVLLLLPNAQNLLDLQGSRAAVNGPLLSLSRFLLGYLPCLLTWLLDPASLARLFSQQPNPGNGRLPKSVDGAREETRRDEDPVPHVN